MTLVKWEPFKDLARMEERLSRLFREPFFSPVWEEGREAFAEWVPAVDIYEDTEQILIKAELPEMDLKDIDVKIENDTLRIHGERRLEHEDQRDRYHKIERVYGVFSRTFTLPRTVAQDKVKATYDRGVLRVTLPKKEETKPKQITV
ncbi:MAG: Hsp20/alpha crystallin family protein, partial [Nitrospirae bacterium]|nr:Hsp20/alpha crystallin family protein [Nitrospirota bacterium]